MILHELRNGEHTAVDCGEVLFGEFADVIVAGAGTAGVYSLLAAAQEGVSVLGIERGGCSGGMCTLGSVNGYYYGGRGGLYEETDRLVREIGQYFCQFGLHPDAKKIVLDRQLAEAGARVWYDSMVLGVYTEGEAVRGVRVLRGDRVCTAGCRVLIDGTSEGHLIRICGVPYEVGRGTDGTMQPFSSVRVFYIGNGRLSRTNFDSGYMNQYEAEDVSRAILYAHSHHSEMRAEDGCFLYAAPLIGVREGLRFEGRERLTLDAILDRRRWEDPLIYAYSDIDKHGSDLAFDEKTYQDWYMLSNLSTVAMKIPVPLGCVLPQRMEGLMTTGRCLSADSYAVSAVRMNRDMFRLGEACGIAAALAVKEGRSVWEIGRTALKKRLLARGCFDSHSSWQIGFHFPGRPDDFTPVFWFENLEEIRAGLDSDKPGVAFWSCRRLGAEVIGDALLEMMRQGEERLRYHAALALGLTGDVRALPVLREIVRCRSDYFFEDCRRSNQLRSANSLILCGRLGGRGLVPEIAAILSPEEFERPLYHRRTGYSYQFGLRENFNLVYFQHLSCAVSALIQIARREEAAKPAVCAALAELGSLRWLPDVTKMPEDTSEYQCAYRIWLHAERFLKEETL